MPKSFTIRLPEPIAEAFEQYRKSKGLRSDNATAVELIAYGLTVNQSGSKVVHNFPSEPKVNQEWLNEVELRLSALEKAAGIQGKPVEEPATPAPVELPERFADVVHPKATPKPDRVKQLEGIRKVMLADLGSLNDASWQSLWELEDELGVERTAREEAPGV